VPLLRQCGTSKLLRQCGTSKLLRACPPPPPPPCAAHTVKAYTFETTTASVQALGNFNNGIGIAIAVDASGLVNLLPVGHPLEGGYHYHKYLLYCSEVVCATDQQVLDSRPACWKAPEELYDWWTTFSVPAGAYKVTLLTAATTWCDGQLDEEGFVWSDLVSLHYQGSAATNLKCCGAITGEYGDQTWPESAELGPPYDTASYVVELMPELPDMLNIAAYAPYSPITLPSPFRVTCYVAP